jgi:D-glycero-alpha-D-manno-heptose 1-phosphate guanylyltransferase
MKRNALDAFDLNTKFSLEQDYFQKQANTSSLYAKEFNSYFIDIGIPTEFERANKEFLDFKY